MLDQKQILLFIQQADEEQWPFPKFFQALKNIGVQSYEVNLNSHHVTYQDDEDSFKIDIGQDIAANERGPFDPQSIEKAIRDHQAQKTSYAQLCTELRTHGVIKYHVDMHAHIIHYRGQDQEVYTENVPTFD